MLKNESFVYYQAFGTAPNGAWLNGSPSILQILNHIFIAILCASCNICALFSSENSSILLLYITSHSSHSHEKLFAAYRIFLPRDAYGYRIYKIYMNQCVWASSSEHMSRWIVRHEWMNGRRKRNGRVRIVMFTQTHTHTQIYAAEPSIDIASHSTSLTSLRHHHHQLTDRRRVVGASSMHASARVILFEGSGNAIT